MNRNKRLLILFVFSLVIIVLLVFKSGVNYQELIIDQITYDSIKSKRCEDNEMDVGEITFNDSVIFCASKDKTLYYSIIESDSNSGNPLVKLRNKYLKIAFLANSEPLVNDRVIKVIVYDDDYYACFDLRCINIPLISVDGNNRDGCRFKCFDNSYGSVNRYSEILCSIYEVSSRRFELLFYTNSVGNNKRKETIVFMNEEIDWMRLVYTEEECINIDKCILILEDSFLGEFLITK